jgi:hypothetical protein
MQSNDEYVRHSIQKMEHPPIFKHGKVKDHPYFYFDGYDEKDRLLYRCKLCEVGRLPVYKLEHHCEENERFFKQCLLREDVRRALLVAERATQILADPLYAKIQALPKQIPAAIDAVHAEFYRYLIAPAADNERDENRLLHRPLKKLKACFQSEALMLLALAVWKAQCLHPTMRLLEIGSSRGGNPAKRNSPTRMPWKSLLPVSDPFWTGHNGIMFSVLAHIGQYSAHKSCPGCKLKGVR